MSSLVDLTVKEDRRRPWRLLVVEDDAADAELVIECLEDQALAGAVTFTRVEQLAAAVECLASTDVDCVLLDLTLPDSLGLATLRVIRAVSSEVAIIVLTGLADHNLENAAIALGAQDFLVKGELTARTLERSATYAIERQRQKVAVRDAGDALIIEVAARELAEEHARTSAESYRTIVELAREGIWAFDAELKTTFVNARMAAMLGFRTHEMIGASLFDFMDDEGRAIATANFARGETDTLDGHHDFMFRSRDGSEVWAIMATTPLLDVDGGSAGSLTMVTDVTQRRRQAAALLEAKTRFESAFDSAPTGMALVSLQGGFMEVNPALLEMLGFQEQQLLAMHITDILGADDAEVVHEALDRLASGAAAPLHMECLLAGLDDLQVWTLMAFAAVDDGSGRTTHVIVQAEDISARKDAEARLVHQTLHDPLTGLPNRVLLHDRLEHTLAQLDRTNESVGVLYIDIDRFKLVNDTLGHNRGDELIAEIGNRLRDVVRPSDTVARLGGDEFVVLAENMTGRGEATAIAERIRVAVGAPFQLDGTDLVPAVSIGIALATDRHRLPDQLLREADIAMYHAKERGKDRFEIFDDALRARAIERLGTETMIRRAINEDRLVVLYQPVLDLTAGAVVGVEALLRIDDPDHGLLLPRDFMPTAEDTGLIVPMGAYVLKQAIEHTAIWRDCGIGTPFKVHVNLSARQVALPTLGADIAVILEANAITGEHLSLELSESVLLASASSTLRSLTTLKELGIDLGVDDFGTGYSSLTYLRRFAVDFVKIDTSFVAGLPDDEEDSTIVRAVIGLGGALGLTTIAEGVETDAQLECLRGLGCDRAQGYYFSTPQPEDRMSEMLGVGTACR